VVKILKKIKQLNHWMSYLSRNFLQAKILGDVENTISISTLSVHPTWVAIFI
jgi:hypothetical protein